MWEDLDHIGDINQYAQSVVDGEKLACKWEKLACQRYFDDLKRHDDDSFDYYFDETAAQKPIKFIELLPHVKGHWAAKRGVAKRIQLEPWQKFNIGNIFGWLHKKTGMRRFTVVYICVPRKNGKSVIASTIGLYMLVEDNEFGAEIFCGATTEKQAWEVFRPAKQIVERTPKLRAAYGLTAHAKSIKCDKKGLKHQADDSRFEPVIGKPGDGSSPSCAILDEVHEHPDDELFETMLTGMGARQQPLLLMITTAGTNPSGPCYAHQKDLQKILDKQNINDQFYGIVYGIDEADDWTKKESLIKANPNAGVSVFIDKLEARQRDAMQSARKQNSFLIKHLNRWVYAKNAWLNMVEWNAQADDTLRIEDFEGCPAIKGLDMSSKLDLTADVTLFQKIINGKTHYYIFGNYYIPEERLKDPENGHYVEWVSDGYLETCEGGSIDYEMVQEQVLEECRIFEVNEVGFDPWGATQIAQNIAANNPNIEVIEIPQNYSMTDAMTEFESLLSQGRIHHDGNPCLTWQMGNVVAKEIDDGKKVRPVKEAKANKIDGAVASIMALSRAILIEEQQPTGALGF